MSDAGVWVKLEDAGSSAPGAAVIDSATHKDPADDTVKPIVATSFVGDGTNGDLNQAYDVYEFLGSGELVVSEPGMVEALIVGGGAAGGTQSGGGGGAGGVLGQGHDELYMTETASVVVGAGSAGGGTSSVATSGEPSALFHFVATGGGYGGSLTRPGGPGGSGGGGAGGDYNTTPDHIPGVPVISQGNPGGTGSTSGSNTAGAGGGGCETAGGDVAAGSNNGGNGGDGTDFSAFIGQSSGTLIVAAGGGGSGGYNVGTPGAGGSGGLGGDGSKSGAAGDGAQNTGSGGGGGGGPSPVSGSGGSGIVIVRVKVAEKSFGDRTRSATPRTAHAARVENGVVRQVIAIPHLDDDDNKITEYCNKIGLPGTWVDTSYTGARRGKYAGVGDLFDPRLRNAEFTSPVEEME